MKEKFRKIAESRFGVMCDRFCNSAWYSLAIGCMCVFTHSFNLAVLGVFLLVLFTIPTLLFCKNSFTLMPSLLLGAFVLSSRTIPWRASGVKYYSSPFRIAVLCFALVLLVVALVFNIIYYEKWRSMFKRAAFTLSLALVTAALFMNGVGSKTVSAWGFGIGVALAAAMVIPYGLLVNCGQYEGKKTFEYFAWIMLVMAGVITAGYVQRFAQHNFDMSIDAVKSYLGLGYVGPNTGSALITMAIPPTFYFVYKYRRGFLFMLLVAAELTVILLTHSRASIIVSFGSSFVIGAVMCFKKKSDALGYWISFGVCIVAGIVLAVFKRAEIAEIFKSFFSDNDISSSRVTLWKIGLEAWKSAPVFGVGFLYLPSVGYWYYSFHNTLLTYLYCTGFVGLAAYCFHRYRSVRVVFSAKLTAERVALALIIAVLLANALVDIGMARIIHLIYYSVILALIECDAKLTKSVAVSSAEPTLDGNADQQECSTVQTEIITNTGTGEL